MRDELRKPVTPPAIHTTIEGIEREIGRREVLSLFMRAGARAESDDAVDEQ
jgi:hypothetical protein